MTSRLNKLVFTSHITFSIAWFGAVAVFLALSIPGITNQDIQVARSAYTAMEISTWFIILPFCIASFGTSLIQATTTKWGLLNHYWIIVKLILTLGSTVLLILHLKPIGQLAHIASDANVAIIQPGLQTQMIADSGAALVVLLAIVTISVYKPWGRTRFALQGKSSGGLSNKTGAEGESFRKYFLMGDDRFNNNYHHQTLVGGGMHGPKRLKYYLCLS